MAEDDRPDAGDLPAAGVILVAFEKLFSGGRGVRRFRQTGLRHVELPHDCVLIEQNPKKSSEWAELARARPPRRLGHARRPLPRTCR